MSKGGRMTLSYASKLAEKVAAEIAPWCERLEIAGSIRRQREDVGDIEMVCIPKFGPETVQPDMFGGAAVASPPVNLLEKRLDDLRTRKVNRFWESRWALLEFKGRPAINGDVRRWGPKYKRVYIWANDQLGPIAIDLFIATPENWGAIFTIRTGPADFSEALVTQIKYHTPFLQDRGHLIRKDTGAVVIVRTEEEYFTLAEVIWLPPEKRNLITFKWAVDQFRRRAARPPIQERKEAGESGSVKASAETPVGEAAPGVTRAVYTDDEVRELIRVRLEAAAGI